jgi:hypothetical protein
MLEWAATQLSTQWAAVMNAPAILIPVALFGLALGWASAWLVLRQALATARDRIEHHRERAEFYKEKLPPAAASEPNPLPVYAARDQPSVQHSVIAKKLEGFWQDGTNLLNQAAPDEKAVSKWLRRSRNWQETVSSYLDLAGLGEEAAMFRTLPVDAARKQFKNARNAEHGAGLNVLEQKLSKLRLILARAAGRASASD